MRAATVQPSLRYFSKEAAYDACSATEKPGFSCSPDHPPLVAIERLNRDKRTLTNEVGQAAFLPIPHSWSPPPQEESMNGSRRTAAHLERNRHAHRRIAIK